MKRQSRVKVKSLTIYLVIIIATSATVGITIYFEENIKESIPAVVSLAAAGSIGVFSYYLQSGGEKKRSNMLYQINKISKEQERANLAMAREPLIRISKEIFDLSNEFEEYLTKVKESIENKQYDLSILRVERTNETKS
jgi:hypothetical protein